jgi:hypothetical protein
VAAIGSADGVGIAGLHLTEEKPINDDRIAPAQLPENGADGKLLWRMLGRAAQRLTHLDVA